LEAFQQYRDCFPQQLPALYMTYVGLKGNQDAYWCRLKEQLAAFEERLIPQIGLSMTKDGSPELRYEHAVAAGEHDAAIERFVAGLGSLDRPAFVRIGYEFNGHWNGYHAEDFVAAWRRVANAIRAAALAHPVALVWTYSPEGNDKAWEPFYPGDAYVDWWGIDLFSPEHLSQSDSHAFCAQANARGFPIMIGESTPRFVGVHAADAWQQWFDPYICFIERFAVRAFCYINWDWQHYPMWSDWGDARMEAAPAELRQRWARFLADSRVVHALP
jgi:hypothetical protein